MGQALQATSDRAPPAPAPRRRSLFSQVNEIRDLHSGESGPQSGISGAKADCHLVEPLFAAEECPAKCLASYSLACAHQQKQDLRALSHNQASGGAGNAKMHD